VDDALLTVVVLAALAHAWMNGMHDASNAVATSLSTGALTPRTALPMSAVLNVVGALFGVAMARSLGFHLVTVPVIGAGPEEILAALLSALAWNTLTWWFGLPSSSSHALIGGLVGAGLAGGVAVDWNLLGSSLALPLLISPVVGFLGAWLLMLVLLRVFRDAAHERAVRGFRTAQSVTAATMSVGHGLQDGQKTMGVLVLALGTVTTGSTPDQAPVPGWVQGSVALALGLGTLAGGWRIIRTLSRRLVRMTPTTGFAAESVASLVLYASAGVGIPVSSTHTVTAAIMGAGATGGLRAIRWGVVRRVVAAWVATPVITFAVAATAVRAVRVLG